MNEQVYLTRPRERQRQNAPGSKVLKYKLLLTAYLLQLRRQRSKVRTQRHPLRQRC